MDLVGTCPKGFWKEWLAEGDCAGDTSTQETPCTLGRTRHRMAERSETGDRFYVVAHGKSAQVRPSFTLRMSHPTPTGV